MNTEHEVPEWKRKNLERLAQQEAEGARLGPEPDLKRLHAKGKEWCSPSFNKYYPGVLTEEEDTTIAKYVDRFCKPKTPGTKSKSGHSMMDSITMTRKK